MPRPGYLSTSISCGHRYLALQHELPVGVWIRSRPRYYTSPGLVPGGGAAGVAVAAALIEGGHRYYISGGWIIWTFFSCRGFLQFTSSLLRKCAILPPVKPTCARIVFSLYAKCINGDMPIGPAVTDANLWGLMVLGPSWWSLSHREPVV